MSMHHLALMEQCVTAEWDCLLLLRFGLKESNAAAPEVEHRPVRDLAVSIARQHCIFGLCAPKTSGLAASCARTRQQHGAGLRADH
jgi:hypothetical protein